METRTTRIIPLFRARAAIIGRTASRVWCALLALLLLAPTSLPPAHAQTTPFNQLPGIGPVSSWEQPGELAFLDRIDRLLALRAAEVPLLRPSSRFIRQSDDGDPLGGGGDGLSPQTAWRCRHMLDVRALLSAQLLSNTAYLFRRGDSFYAAPPTSLPVPPQGLPHITSGSFSFGSYTDPDFPSSDKPRLLGFLRPPPAAWRKIEPTLIELDGPTLPPAVFWVRGRLASSDPATGFRAVPYVRAASLAAVDQLPHSFFFDPSTPSGPKLRVNLGPANAPDDIASLELAVAAGPCFLLSTSEGTRIDGLIIEGWGMDQPQIPGGSILSTAGGTPTALAVTLVTNCDWAWTSYHGVASVVSAQAGGVLSLVDCAFGYHMQRSFAEGGGGDGAVSFATLGQNEFFLLRCSSFGGGLRRSGTPGADSDTQGMPVYSHTGGSRPVGLVVRKDCRFIPAHPARARFNDYAASGESLVNAQGGIAFVPANSLDHRFYRAFILDEYAEIDGGPGGAAWRCVDINSRILRRVNNTSQGLNAYFWGVAANAQHGIAINRDTEIRFAPNFPGYFFLSEVRATHFHNLLFSRLRITGAGPDTPSPFFSCEASGAFLGPCRLDSCIVSNETPIADIRFNYPNAPASAAPQGDGGMANVAFFRVPPAHYSATLAPITLASPASYPIDQSGRAALPPELAPVLPTLLDVQYDITRARRPALSTPGPLEAAPITCNADFNRDAAADFFDYLDFVAAFDAQRSSADANRDGAIDFFDYLDFVAAFDAGCP